MTPIEQVYPDCVQNYDDGETYFSSPYDYDPMLEGFGFKVLLKVDDDDYQGDSRVLYQDGQQIGYLQFGWGSCSGCDALQACNSTQEIEDLRSRLHDSIRWFETKDAALAWFVEHDWEGDYSWHDKEQKEFVEKAKEILRPS